MADSDLTHWTMIRGAAAGTAEARKAFAERYLDVVRGYLGARWRGGPLARDVDDAAQDVFLECFKERGALEKAAPDEAGRFRTFLYAIVRNVARRWEKRAVRARAGADEGLLDPAAIEAREVPLSKAFDRGWAMALMRRAGALHARRARADARQGERHVEVLELRFGEQLPIREIAKRWGEDPAKVHRIYAKARAEFRRALVDVVRAEEGGTVDEAEDECARLLGFLR